MSTADLTKLAVFAFDAEARVWKAISDKQSVSLSEPSSNHGLHPKQNASLCRIATLNVLTDTFPGIIELAIKSPQRVLAYTKGYTPKEILKKGSKSSEAAASEQTSKLVHPFSDVGADILALNEVSLNIAKMFFGGSDDVMSHCGYRYMTFYGAKAAKVDTLAQVAMEGITLDQLIAHLLTISDSASTHAHGCLIASKHPIREAWRGDASREVYVEVMAPALSAQRDKASSSCPLIVCSLHTTAYATMETKAQRAIQIKEAATRCRLLCERSASSTDATMKPTFVLLGDLNLHDTNEDRAILDNNLVDTFAAVNEEMLGQAKQDTFSPTTNPMIKRYIPAENRHMRLDRILFPVESHWTEGDANKSEDNNNVKYAFASPLKLWADTPIDVPGELTLSDHFGLCVDIALVDPKNSSMPSTILGDTTSRYNSESNYPGKEKMEARAALPSDQCNRRVGVVANAVFFSTVAVNIAFSHLPWVLSQYWARYTNKSTQ